MRSSISAALFAVCIGVFIYLGEGIGGFRPFINLEALLFIFVGLGFFLSSSYPVREILTSLRCGFFGAPPENAEAARVSAEILEHSAAGAAKISVLGTIFALVLVFSSMEKFDAGILTRRLALVMGIPFFGYFLASMVFTPMARRVSRQALKR